jgi:hypothetical protein
MIVPRLGADQSCNRIGARAPSCNAHYLRIPALIGLPTIRRERFTAIQNEVSRGYSNHYEYERISKYADKSCRHFFRDLEKPSAGVF